MGLGDHLLCFGLIVELAKNYDEIYLFCFPKYKNSVEFLYKDEKKIIVIPIEEEKIGEFVSNYHFCDNKNVLSIGFDESRALQTKMTFDEAFYFSKGIEFKKKYSNFKLRRNFQKELELFNKYNLVEGEYIFVHDDSERGYNIKIYGENVIRPSMSMTDNIFDYLYIIENAKEVHCIDSCFFIMSDFLIQNKNINYHINARGDYSVMYPHQGGGEYAHPRYQKNWTIIE